MSAGTRSTVDHAQVLVQPPFVFLGYLLSAFLLQWAVPFSLPQWMPLRILGIVIALLGLLLGFSAARAFHNAHTTLNPHAPVTALVTTGPYRFTRNPIYLGFLIVLIGLTLALGTWWGLLVSPFFVGTMTRWVIHAEEAYLESKFEDDYRAYTARVRRWL